MFQELGLIRKPASFMTSMTDERGDELLYAGMPISKILESNMGVGGVLSLLWFQRRWVDNCYIYNINCYGIETEKPIFLAYYMTTRDELYILARKSDVLVKIVQKV